MASLLQNTYFICCVKTIYTVCQNITEQFIIIRNSYKNQSNYKSIKFFT